MNIVHGIYKIQSKIKPGRIYIGSSINIHNRWIDHLKELRSKKHHNGRIQNHYNKYGELDLQFSIIVGCDKENLISYEQFYIDSLNPFFNICKTAGSPLGCKQSDETKRKLSEINIGRKHTEETKRIIGEYSRNRKRNPCTDETKLKISLANKGRKRGPRSEEVKMKISKSHLGVGHPCSEETKQKMRILSTGRIVPKELRLQIRNSMIKVWEDRKCKSK